MHFRSLEDVQSITAIRALGCSQELFGNASFRPLQNGNILPCVPSHRPMLSMFLVPILISAELTERYNHGQLSGHN